MLRLRIGDCQNWTIALTMVSVLRDPGAQADGVGPTDRNTVQPGRNPNRLDSRLPPALGNNARHSAEVRGFAARGACERGRVESRAVVKAVLVAAAGALSEASRVISSTSLPARYSEPAFFGTIIVNVVGSLIIGVLTELMAMLWSASTEMRLFLVVGILGGFPTVWSFSLEVAVLYTRGQWMLCATYLSSSIVFPSPPSFLALLWCDIWLRRRLNSDGAFRESAGRRSPLSRANRPPP